MRERMLAFVQGREHDRVPFAQYTDNAGTNDEVWALLGRENMGILEWTWCHRADTPNCRWEHEDFIRDGKKGLRRTLVTPEGPLWEERFYEPTYNSTAIATHFVKELDDYRLLMSYFRDMTIREDLTRLYEVIDMLGDNGLPHVSVERTPFQRLWVEWVGIQDLAVHMIMNADVVAEVIALMTDVQHRVFEVVCKSIRDGAPIPYVDVPDNITAPIIGEDYFRTYCVPAYNELADMLDETGKDIPVFVHMDGDLAPLWDAIGESRVRGLDSMSPPPDNDTSVAEAVSRWPEMRVAINFPSSVHLLKPEEIYQHAMQILEEGGHTGRLQIQISENGPPYAWRTSLPAILKAINDFGPIRGA